MEWKYGTRLDDTAYIEEFEQELGVRLPEAFKEIAREHDGATLSDPTATVFNPATGADEQVLCGQLLPFGDPPDMFSLNLGNEVVPNGLIAFGADPGGYLFAFDYRTDPKTDDPPVVLIHRDNPPEHYVLPVADNFGGFISKLEPLPPGLRNRT